MSGGSSFTSKKVTIVIAIGAAITGCIILYFLRKRSAAIKRTLSPHRTDAGKLEISGFQPSSTSTPKKAAKKKKSGLNVAEDQTPSEDVKTAREGSIKKKEEKKTKKAAEKVPPLNELKTTKGTSSLEVKITKSPLTTPLIKAQSSASPKAKPKEAAPPKVPVATKEKVKEIMLQVPATGQVKAKGIILGEALPPGQAKAKEIVEGEAPPLGQMKAKEAALGGAAAPGQAKDKEILLEETAAPGRVKDKEVMAPAEALAKRKSTPENEQAAKSKLEKESKKPESTASQEEKGAKGTPAKAVEKGPKSPDLKTAKGTQSNEALIIPTSSGRTTTDSAASLPRVLDSYCYCKERTGSLSTKDTPFDESVMVRLLPTVVKPVFFDPYTPTDLTKPKGGDLSPKSLKLYERPANHPVIVPFLPILHGITYAAKHTQLLAELDRNYDLFEPNTLEQMPDDVLP